MRDIDLMHDAAGIVGKWATWERHLGYDFDYLNVPDPTDPDARVAWNPLRFETDAFMIVKTLVARGFGFRLYGPANISEEIKDPSWCCALSGNGTQGVHCDLECARAITIACLKAVGVNTE